MCAVLIGLVTPIHLDLLLIKNVDAMIVALSSKERRYGCRQRRYNRGREWMDWSSLRQEWEIAKSIITSSILSRTSKSPILHFPQ